MEQQVILLNDILNLSETDLKNTKIRFNMSNNTDFDPLKLYKDKDYGLYNGHFWNSKMKTFKEGQIAIGFLKIEADEWLLFDVSEITKDLDIYNGMGYEYQTLSKYKKYFGRVIVKFKNNSQNLIRNAESVIDECEVVQILRESY